MYDVTALGEVLIDFTPYGTSEGGQALFEQNPGGAPANVLAALERLGQRTAFIGKVGDDMHGQLLKETLESCGVDTRGLVVDPDYFTTLAFVALKNGERSFSFARKPGADTQLRQEEVNTEVLKNTKIFHCGSLSLTMNRPGSATFFALKTAKEAGALISYDPNYRALLWKSPQEAMEHMRSVIPYADIMKISDEETALLTGHEDPDEAADALLAQGVLLRTGDTGKPGSSDEDGKIPGAGKGKGKKGRRHHRRRRCFLGRHSLPLRLLQRESQGAHRRAGAGIRAVCQRGGRPLRGKTGRHTRYGRIWRRC